MKKLRNGATLGVLSAALALGACIPLFTNGLFQTLRLSFVVDETLAAGDERLVQTVSFPEDVKDKKTFVQISGRLIAAEGGDPRVGGQIGPPVGGGVGPLPCAGGSRSRGSMPPPPGSWPARTRQRS